jgi:hypothetical protein
MIPTAAAGPLRRTSMSDFSAVPLSVEDPAELATSFAQHAKAFVSGLLFTAVVAAVGMAAVVVLLVAGVVGAPVVAAGVAYAVLRHRRAERARTFAAAQPTS